MPKAQRLNLPCELFPPKSKEGSWLNLDILAGREAPPPGASPVTSNSTFRPPQPTASATSRGSAEPASSRHLRSIPVGQLFRRHESSSDPKVGAPFPTHLWRAHSLQAIRDPCKPIQVDRDEIKILMVSNAEMEFIQMVPGMILSLPAAGACDPPDAGNLFVLIHPRNITLILRHYGDEIDTI